MVVTNTQSITEYEHIEQHQRIDRTAQTRHPDRSGVELSNSTTFFLEGSLGLQVDDQF